MKPSEYLGISAGQRAYPNLRNGALIAFTKPGEEEQIFQVYSVTPNGLAYAAVGAVNGKRMALPARWLHENGRVIGQIEKPAPKTKRAKATRNHGPRCSEHGATWTAEETAYLIANWEHAPPENIGKRLDRSLRGVLVKATALMKAGRLVSGKETLGQAEKRTGYLAGTLLRIIARFSVPHSEHDTHRGPRGHVTVINRAALDVAISDWMNLYTLRQAAEKVGIDPNTLRQRLLRAGMKRGSGLAGKAWMLHESDIDRIFPKQKEQAA